MMLILELSPLSKSKHREPSKPLNVLIVQVMAVNCINWDCYDGWLRWKYSVVSNQVI